MWRNWLPVFIAQDLCVDDNVLGSNLHGDGPSEGVGESIVVVNRWDEFYTAHAPQRSMKTEFFGSMLCRGVWSRGLRPLLVLESPRMSLTRDALWYNGL